MADYRIVTHDSRPFAAARISTTLGEIGNAVPPLLGTVMEWIGACGAVPAGPPFFNYVSMGPSGQVEVEAGFPTRGVLRPGPGIITGDLPAGRYAQTRFAGPYPQVAGASMALWQWTQAEGLALDGEPAEGGYRNGTRLEIYLTAHDANPPVTDLEFRLRD